MKGLVFIAVGGLFLALGIAVLKSRSFAEKWVRPYGVYSNGYRYLFGAMSCVAALLAVVRGVGRILR